MSKLKIWGIGAMQVNSPSDKKMQLIRSVTELIELFKELGFDFYYYPKLVIIKQNVEKAKKAIETQHVEFLLIQNT